MIQLNVNVIDKLVQHHRSNNSKIRPIQRITMQRHGKEIENFSFRFLW